MVKVSLGFAEEKTVKQKGNNTDDSGARQPFALLQSIVDTLHGLTQQTSRHFRGMRKQRERAAESQTRQRNSLRRT